MPRAAIIAIRWLNMCQLPFNLTILQLLADHRNIFLTKLFLAASFLGSADCYILIVILIYVMWDKRLAIRLSVLVLLTMSLNYILKNLIGNPRPFVREGTYLKKWGVSAAEAKLLATEYSTPSGHAMGSSVFYAYLYAFIKRRTVRCLAVVAIVLIGLSRPYLGVHYVEDVLLGWAIGLPIALVAARYTDRIRIVWNRRSYGAQIGIAVAASFVLSLLSIAMHGWRAVGLPGALMGYTGFLTGIVIAYPLELKRVNFNPRIGSAAFKMLRFAVSMGMIVFVLLFFGSAFGRMADRFSLLGYLLQYIRYTLAGFAGIFLAPLICSKIETPDSQSAETE